MMMTNLLIERPSQRQDWATVRAALVDEQQTILSRMIAARPDEKNQAVMISLVALDQWVFAHLSGDAQAGDQDAYRPDEAASQDELIAMFQEARDRVIGLVDQIESGEIEATSLDHPRFGALSAKGVLYTLRALTNMESKKLR